MKQSVYCVLAGLLGVVAARTDELLNPQAAQAQSPPGPVYGQSQPEQQFDAAGLSGEEAINVFVYEQNNRSVVNITTRTVRSEGLFGFRSDAEGSGSGVVMDSRGHVLTSYHVIEDAHQVKVTLFNGKTFEATLVGADPINDSAVIRINAPHEVLFPIRMGDSGTLRVGMKVFAIGNPFGLERTMTTGIISSLNRSLQITRERSIKSIIQIDAAINPGNSGGPLLDSHGRLIGINTAIASKTGQSAGVGFAIPSNLIARVVPQLIQHGRVIRPDIGIQSVYEIDDGLLLTRLTPGGPAERAGLRGPRLTRELRGPYIIERIDRLAADTIVAIDGRPVKTVDEFLSYVESKQPSDEVVLTILRAGARIKVPVRLDSDRE